MRRDDRAGELGTKMQDRHVMGGQMRGIGRRGVLRGAAAGTLGVAGSSVARRGWAADAQLNVAAYGGVINDFLTKDFGVPFAARTGIKVNFGSNASMALAKLQVAAGAPSQWDITELTGSEYVEAIKQNLILPFDYSIVDGDKLVPGYKESHGVKFSSYMFVMAWDQRKIPDDQAPKTWAEFWDTQKYPGKRSIDANLTDGSALEVALLADGVPVEKLYPLDVERGLKSFEKLGRGNIIWYNANQEPVQQLTSGAVPLATVFHGRVLLANKGGAQLGFTPAYSSVSGNYLTVIRTTGQAKAAFELINFILTDPEAGAAYMKDTNYAVPDAASFALLPKSVQDILPTSPAMRDKVFFKNDAWWAANLGPTIQRFKEWQLAG
jgi:putative spermidine/putrescine transport system substrate-binding protein